MCSTWDLAQTLGKQFLIKLSDKYDICITNRTFFVL